MDDGGSNCAMSAADKGETNPKFTNPVVGADTPARMNLRKGGADPERACLGTRTVLSSQASERSESAEPEFTELGADNAESRRVIPRATDVRPTQASDCGAEGEPKCTRFDASMAGSAQQEDRSSTKGPM